MNALLFSPVQIRIAAALCVSLLLASCATTRPAPKAAATPAASVQPEQPKALSPPAAESALPPATTQAQTAPPALVQQDAQAPATGSPAHQPVPMPHPAPMPAAVKAPAPVPTPTTPKPTPIPATTPAPVVSAAKPAPSPASAKARTPVAEPAPVQTSKAQATKADAPQPGKSQTQPPKPEIQKAEPLKPEPTDSAPVTQPPAATEPAAPATVAVVLDNLPLSIQGQWTLDRNESRCTLQSTTQRMDDGQGGTRVSLWLTANELTFQTESDIDISYSGTGISIDSGRHFALESVERRTNLAFSKQRSALLAAMKSGQTLELTLGFWPTWPVTQTYSARFPLQHFASAYAAWETCNTLLNQR